LTAGKEKASAYLHRGGARALQNDFKAAVADYDEALQLDPSLWVAYVSRGHARYHRRDPGALVDYQSAYLHSPHGTARELLRTLEEAARRDPEDVLANCDQHLRLNPHDVIAHGRRGLTLILLGRQDEAETHLHEVRQLAPGIAKLLDLVLRLARAHRQAGPPCPSLPLATE
jgi:tetratricopeptide (TPR) repeat protein